MLYANCQEQRSFKHYVPSFEFTHDFESQNDIMVQKSENKMNVELYLNKIGQKKEKPSLSYLNKLITSHQRIISFNNLAVFFRPGTILDLSLENLFEKVVIKGEGGYCFENNKVFYYLLKSLGFDVDARAARVIYDKTGDVPRTHRTTIVSLDGMRYLVDVGFGKDVPSEALPLGVEKNNGHQVIMKESLYYHQLLKDDTIINLYVFDDGNYQESDFTLANYYTNTHPDSKFVNHLIVTRKNQEKIELINDNKYSSIINGKREDKMIPNQEEFDFYLSKFGITEKYDFKFLEKKFQV